MTSVDRPLSRPAQDIAESLRAHQLFAELDARELAEIAQRVQLETFARGAIILSQDDAPPGRVRVVRRGSVDLIDDGRAERSSWPPPVGNKMGNRRCSPLP
jgi:signal-transduction protein with cAMP-binding, CBS, and nucleotidyltransferase domain